MKLKLQDMSATHLSVARAQRMNRNIFGKFLTF